MMGDATKWRRALKTVSGTAGVISAKGLVFGPHPAGGSGESKRQEKSGHKKIRLSVGAVSATDGVFSTDSQFSLLERGCQRVPEGHREQGFTLPEK